MVLVSFLGPPEKGLLKIQNSQLLKNKQLFVPVNFNLIIVATVCNPFKHSPYINVGVYIRSVGTSQQTHNSYITNTNPLILFTDINNYCGNHMKQICYVEKMQKP